MAQLIDETGNIYGQLTVIRQAESDNGARWLCQCSCGNTCTVSGGNLRGGETISCGCYRNRLKGQSGSPEYYSWHSMINRCTNPEHEAFHNYGGRGISICPEWSEFETFLSDMGERPEGDYSLDRIDNSGNYEPSNCRWATRREQNGNRRNNLRLSVGEETKILSQWARDNNISRHTIGARLGLGWTEKDAIMKPKRTAREISFDGKTQTIKEWANQLGMKRSTLDHRLNVGWPIEQALTNRNGNRLVSIGGETKTLAQWGRDGNIPYLIIKSRLRRGWIDEDAIMKPIATAQRILFNGKRQTLSEWAQQTGIEASLIRIRLKRGWSIERALTTGPIQRRLR